MALVQHNATLEYATNTLTFWLYGDEGEELPFDSGTSFNIERIDNTTSNYSVTGSISGNSITFVVTPPISMKATGDSTYDYDNPEYNHVYSVKSGNNVYIVGKLNLIEVA